MYSLPPCLSDKEKRGHMENIIKAMRERISKLEEEKDLKESEIEEKIAEWKNSVQDIHDALCDESNVDSFDSETDLVELASEIQELKDALNSLREEIVEAKIYDEWYIGESYVCAIENGDFSGLDNEDEVEDVQDFINKIADYPDFCLVWGEESGFEFCHISGLRSNCLLARLVLVG